MRILIISNYYKPEIGAAANRISLLAEGFVERGNMVDVLCPLPNYPMGKIYSDYKKRMYKKETINGVNIYRFWTFNSNSSNSVIRLMAMLSFAITIWIFSFWSFSRKWDRVIVQCPPIFVGLSGVLFGRLFGKKVIVNISDLWPLSAKELGVLKDGYLYRFLEKVESYIYQISHLIVCQSDESKQHIKRIAKKRAHVYRNTPIKMKLVNRQNLQTPIRIVYAGLLGVAQDLVGTLNDLDSCFDSNLILDIYGDGNQIDDIIKISESNNYINYKGKLSKKDLLNKYIDYHFAFVPLAKPIYGAVPSKIFELMNISLPIIFYGEGEGSTIIDDLKIGYSTNNISKLAEILNNLSNLDESKYLLMKENALEFAISEYNFEYQFNSLCNFILDDV